MAKAGRKRRWVLGEGYPVFTLNARDVGIKGVRSLNLGNLPNGGVRVKLILEEVGE